VDDDDPGRETDLREWADAAGGTDDPGRPDGADRPPADPPEDPDPVELGCALLARLDQDELSVAAVLDRVEAVTTTPATQRAILEEAERRGVVERDGPTVRPTGGTPRDLAAEVVQKDGEFDCERCGAGLSTGHFVRTEAGDVGPYGSTCIRKVTGRE
jgi:hypothetical protein